MKKNRIKLIASACILAFSAGAYAHENENNGVTPTHGEVKSVMTACAAATAQIDLNINNVRATLLTGGDMWWNLQSAQYEVPYNPNETVQGPKSIFAGSLWIGGIDGGGQLKVAAMTYRQTGNDYWPGPLTSAATTDAGTCVLYDRFWKVNRADVEAYKNWVQAGSIGAVPISTSAAEPILSWPAYGPEGQALAPYYDYNGDNFYDPAAGDYPYFDYAKLGDCTRDQLFGDQAIWWVFNDKGNLHTETGGAAIGLEIQAQAFAFKTVDEINDMTFYNYKIINKSTYTLTQTHFGVWVDSDLGGYNDDYVGCDAQNGFGYQYNGDNNDEGSSGVLGYGLNPPAVGVDFFRGPYADANGVDDAAINTLNGTGYADTYVDNERLGMERFMYYNNNTDPINGNPNASTDFYNYLIGKWQNGSYITYGGNAIGGSTPCKFVFPGDSDPTWFGTNFVPQANSNWSELTENNPFIDRRFMQVAGPFTLLPGAVNTITTGVVWARATQGGPMASVALLKGADKKAQKLFNNCFATLDGPTAPDMNIQELQNELILTWTNSLTSNDSAEMYSEDPDKAVATDSLYRFQGYQIYQLKDNTVSATEVSNVDRARLVFECDKKDTHGQIVNYTYDVALGANVPTEMVNGADAGIVHSISITTDKFATGDDKLINHKQYYYMIIAYGYSPSEEFNSSSPYQDAHPYIAGRLNVQVYTGIPHNPAPEAGGTEAHSTYGSGPKLKRIEGQGNGGNVLDLTPESENDIVTSATSRIKNPIYQNARGPVNIKVIDPLNIPDNADFRIMILDTTNSITLNSKWILVKLPGGTKADTVYSDRKIATPNEQIINGQPSGVTTTTIPQWGISVNIAYTYDPAAALSTNNGALESSMTFSDDTKQWLTGVPDVDGSIDLNWIRSGTSSTSPYQDYAGVDNGQAYEKLVGGTWAPYRLCGFTTQPAAGMPIQYRGGPAWDKYQNLALMKNMASVDVILTSDQSKWTRCPVIELQEETTLSQGGAPKMSLRRAQSVDKNGTPASSGSGASTDPNAANYISETGMGWFPGYAVNLETGERLNMAFGEDSWLVNDHGADMKWNPTSHLFSSGFDPLFGGKHYIYVFGHNGDKLFPGTDAFLANQLRDVPRYDAGQVLVNLFKAVESAGSTGSTAEGYKREVYSDAMWVNIPMLMAGHSLLETDVKIRLRVAKSYQRGYSTTTAPLTDTALVSINDDKPVYEFNTSDIETHTHNADAAKDAMALINIVPNPYYAYSGYEKKALETLVKITNLPEKATISIYTLNGNLVRRLQKDDSSTSMNWDLKNESRIPIASGLYIIHIKVDGVGEKVLKWFGVLRPIDLDAY